MWVLPGAAIATGGASASLNLWMGAEFVWVAAGSFFVAVGIGAYLLGMAWVVGGTLGRVLRSWGFSLLIIVAVLSTFVWTVVLGVGAFL